MIVEATERGMMTALLAYSFGGILLTVLTAVIYYRGLRFFNPRVFFRVTSIFLLITASSLVLAATRRLIQSDVLPSWRDQLWDTSWLLDERTGVGQVVSLMTGYQSSPSGMLLTVFLAYWASALAFYFRGDLFASRKMVLSTP
jgi:high-affinity iron transporter